MQAARRRCKLYSSGIAKGSREEKHSVHTDESKVGWGYFPGEYIASRLGWLINYSISTYPQKTLLGNDSNGNLKHKPLDKCTKAAIL